MTNSPVLDPPSAATVGSRTDVQAVLMVLRASDDEIVIRGQRGAPALPWFRTWLPCSLGIITWFAALAGGVGSVSWVALCVPAGIVVRLLGRRRTAIVTLSRGSRVARWERGHSRLAVIWQGVDVPGETPTIDLRLETHRISLPTRRRPYPAEVKKAAAFLETFCTGLAQPAALTPVLRDGFFQDFGFLEVSPERVVAMATERLVSRWLVGLTAWASATTLAIALASTGRTPLLVALALALAPLLSWVVPVRRLSFEHKQGLRINGGDVSDVDIDDRRSNFGAYVEAFRGRRCFRLVGPYRDGLGIHPGAEFLQAFSQPVDGPPSEAPGRAAADLFKWDGSGPVTFAGKMRLRALPLERSSVVLGGSVVGTLPIAVAGFGLGPGMFVVGTILLALLSRSLLQLARPTVTIECGTRHVVWRFRKSALRLRWKVIQPDENGKGLVVLTEAGLLRVLLPRRASDRFIRMAIGDLERIEPPYGAALLTPAWPHEFTTALDLLEFDAVTPFELRFRAGRMILPAFVLFFFPEAALAFGLARFDLPAVPAAMMMICLMCWPFLFSVRDMVIPRGSQSITVRSRGEESQERLEATMFRPYTIGSFDAGYAHGLSIVVNRRRLSLPGVTDSMEKVAQTGGAIMEYGGLQVPGGRQ